MLEHYETSRQPELELLRSILHGTTWLFRRENGTVVRAGPLAATLEGATSVRPLRYASPSLRQVNLGLLVVGVHEIKARRQTDRVRELLNQWPGLPADPNETGGWTLAHAVFGDLEFSLRLLAFGQVAGFWRPEYRDLTGELVGAARRAETNYRFSASA